MTLRDWLDRRSPEPPAVLADRVLALLGADAGADVDAGAAADACLAAAERGLRALVAEERFARADALDLLAIDALATYAFELASTSGAHVGEIDAQAERAARAFSLAPMSRG